MSTTETPHLAERLWAEHQTVAPYPAGCLPVPTPIPGTAFFPGGYGLWRPDPAAPLPPWPLGGTMVLGHDFHSETGYKASLARGWEDPKQPTWHVLTRLLTEAGIAFEECFFTNAYMGLRAGSATTGRFPGSTDPAFVARCQEFLRHQLSVQRPRLVLTLGIWVPRLLAPLAPELGPWSTAQTFRQLDDSGPLRRDVSLSGAGCTVAALTHPSLWHVSVRHRSYQGLGGKAAELALLSAAVVAANA